ncbi:dihydrodipicolinate synthase family protein [Nakamurella alba]|uniref:dihydrodipicolinate synthase family protein n=1 Tax=Nakamurella alba TaxID=2665158 RepID=UPI0018A9D50C|nr:dihydrodipicolinate synthase family protein [Nakamurella alba]
MTALPTAGLTVVAVTPLDRDGAVDVPGIGELMEFYLRCGVSGVTLLGVMGEANRMTDDESVTVTRAALEALDGRVPAIVGVSDASLQRLVALARAASGLGAAGVLVQPLAGLRGDAAVVGYFRAVCEALGPGIPVCVQDFPRSSGVGLSLAAWRGIVESCPSVQMLKHEPEPSLAALTAVRQAEAEGLRRVTVLGGNNGLALLQELDRGADGAMTGFSYPDALVTVDERWRTGERDRARDLFDRHLPLNLHEWAGGLAVRKEILRRRGALASATCRYPLRPLSAADQQDLDVLLERLTAAPVPVGAA